MSRRSPSRRVLRGLPIIVMVAQTSLASQEVPDTVELSPLVVTAHRIPLAPDALTAAVSVLSGAELEARGIRYVSDALTEVPAAVVVPIGSYGGVTSLFLRGGESDYVKVLVDGVAVNAPGGSYDFASLTTDNVDRIEIVRGPASVLYGSDAVTGVIQVFTKRGGPRTEVDVYGDGGTNGRAVVGASVAGQRGPVRYTLGASRLRTAGTYDFNNRYTNGTASGSVEAAFTDRTNATLALRWEDNTIHFPTDGSGAPVDSNQFTFDESLAASLQLDHRFSEVLQATLTLTNFDLDGGFEDTQDSPADTLGFAYASRRRSHVARRSLDARAHVLASSRLLVTAGTSLEIDQERQRGETTSNFGTGGSTEASEPFDAQRRNLATYIDGIVDLPLPASVHLGARIEDNESFGTFFTYRLGLVYRLGPDTRVRGSIGTGFKAPTFAETFANTPFEVGNPNLDPERSRSWEVGAEHVFWEGRLSLWAGYFDQRFRDLVQYVFADPGEPTYQNLPEATARGLEGGVRLKLANGLGLSGHYSYVDTETVDPGAGGEPGSVFEVGKPLLRRPAHTVRVGGVIRLANRATATLTFNRVGSRDDLTFEDFSSRRVRLPAYTTVDASAVLDILAPSAGRRQLHGTLKVENVFDHAYETVAGFPGRGRAIFAGLRLRF